MVAILLTLCSCCKMPLCLTSFELAFYQPPPKKPGKCLLEMYFSLYILDHWAGSAISSPRPTLTPAFQMGLLRSKRWNHLPSRAWLRSQGKVVCSPIVSASSYWLHRGQKVDMAAKNLGKHSLVGGGEGSQSRRKHGNFIPIMSCLTWPSL